MISNHISFNTLSIPIYIPATSDLNGLPIHIREQGAANCQNTPRTLSGSTWPSQWDVLVLVLARNTLTGLNLSRGNTQRYTLASGSDDEVPVPLRTSKT
jgi:hypothetical protein